MNCPKLGSEGIARANYLSLLAAHYKADEAAQAATVRHEEVMAAIAVSHASIMRALLERSRR
jgi:hypothetical protein